MISKIWLENVRSFSCREFEFSPSINVLHGLNGCGKTTILESIHLLSQGFSFRSRDLKELIKWNESNFLMRGSFSGNIEVYRGISLSSQKYDIKENGINLKSLSEFFGKYPAIIMQPSDIELLRGSPDIRRRWINELLCFRSISNISLLKKYNRVLLQRNKWLKNFKRGEIDNEDVFFVLTEQLIDLGTKIWLLRMQLIREISSIVRNFYQQLSSGKEKITFLYKSSILKAMEDSGNINSPHDTEDENYFKDIFQKKIKKLELAEKSFGSTLIGPHRDDISIGIEKKEMRYFGSQGQCRTSAIAMGLASFELANQFVNSPILLLDDIFAELDSSRRTLVAKLISEKNCQVVIATPELKELPFDIDKSIKL